MTNVVSPDEQWYSTRRVADLFDVSIETVVTWINQGKIEGKKINGFWRISRSSVIRFGNSKFGPQMGETNV